MILSLEASSSPGFPKCSRLITARGPPGVAVNMQLSMSVGTWGWGPRTCPFHRLPRWLKSLKFETHSSTALLVDQAFVTLWSVNYFLMLNSKHLSSLKYFLYGKGDFKSPGTFSPPWLQLNHLHSEPWGAPEEATHPISGIWQAPVSAILHRWVDRRQTCQEPVLGGAEDFPWAELMGKVSGSQTGFHNDIMKG